MNQDSIEFTERHGTLYPMPPVSKKPTRFHWNRAEFKRAIGEMRNNPIKLKSFSDWWKFARQYKAPLSITPYHEPQDLPW